MPFHTASFIKNADRVVSKDEVFETVWQGRIVSDGTLNSRINALRRAFGDDGASQSVIKNAAKARIPVYW